jgi:hypothetical protein
MTNPDSVVVERLLTQLQELKGDAVAPSSSPLSTPHRRPPPVAAGARPRRAVVSLPSVPGVWARVALAALLGAALTQWPYPSSCGVGLGLKIAATGVVAIAGGWAAARSWRRRMAVAHITALLILAWGLALLTHDVMPRTRYWYETAAWVCPPAKRAFQAPPSAAVEVVRMETVGHLPFAFR